MQELVTFSQNHAQNAMYATTTLAYQQRRLNEKKNTLEFTGSTHSKTVIVNIVKSLSAH